MAHLDESWLDDAGHLERCDSRGSLRALATAGAQVREALTLAREAGIDGVAGYERPRSVLGGALGGSERVGDVLQTLAQPSSPVPVMTRRDVPLPGWVGPLDLVIAVSLSGRAEGPLALAAEAARRGASLLTVGADDSPLADVCARARGVHIGVGRGRVSSRTSLWSLLTPVLMGARRLGLVDVSDDDLLVAAAMLDAESETLRPSSEHFVNPAKLAALQLAGTVPVALADGPVTFDGDPHARKRPLRTMADALRQNEIAMGGLTVMRIPRLALRVSPEPFFAQIQRYLSAHGCVRA